jgi:hypothetical protein
VDVAVGYGDTQVLLPPPGTTPYRILILSEKPLQEHLPMRIDLEGGESGGVTGFLLETSSGDGTVTTSDRRFILR